MTTNFQKFSNLKKHPNSRSGYVVYNLASECSKFLVLKTKSIPGMHGYDAIMALQSKINNLMLPLLGISTEQIPKKAASTNGKTHPTGA